MYSTCIYSAIIPLQLTFTKLANFSHPSDLIIINISSMFMILILKEGILSDKHVAIYKS